MFLKTWFKLFHFTALDSPVLLMSIRIQFKTIKMVHYLSSPWLLPSPLALSLTSLPHHSNLAPPTQASFLLSELFPLLCCSLGVEWDFLPYLSILSPSDGCFLLTEVFFLPSCLSHNHPTTSWHFLFFFLALFPPYVSQLNMLQPELIYWISASSIKIEAPWELRLPCLMWSSKQ